MLDISVEISPQKWQFYQFLVEKKRLSEVGFEPTPTFVDQNTPVRKSSTLESGALDRSAILTCQVEKVSKVLFTSNPNVDIWARWKTLRTKGIRWHTTSEISGMARGTSSNGRALDSHSRGTGIDTPVLQLNFFAMSTTRKGIFLNSLRNRSFSSEAYWYRSGC